MWVLLFLAALVFVLGGALILLRSAKTPKIPDTVKAQPYEEDKSDDWWFNLFTTKTRRKNGKNSVILQPKNLEGIQVFLICFVLKK